MWQIERPVPLNPNPNYQPAESAIWTRPLTPGDKVQLDSGETLTAYAVRQRSSDHWTWVRARSDGEWISLGIDEIAARNAMAPDKPAAAALKVTPAIDVWDPLYFGGETVFVLGGGPSLSGFDPSRTLRGRATIAVNSSCYLRNNPDAVLVFLDEIWALTRPDTIAAWPGPIVTPSVKAKMQWPQQVTLVTCETPYDNLFRPLFAIADRPRVAMVSSSSGHLAISVAVALGANRVVLLGYDMRLSESGRSHWHDDYESRTKATVLSGFLDGFVGWNEMARRAGVEILNATPGSALEEFPLVTLDEAARLGA